MDVGAEVVTCYMVKEGRKVGVFMVVKLVLMMVVVAVDGCWS